MILQIQKGENNTVLRTKSQPIDKIDLPAGRQGEEILNLIKDMMETMKKLDGMGLAANQIGKNIRIFVVNPRLCKNFVFINPEINKMSKKTELAEEGCLSLPNVFIKKERVKTLKINAIDENGKKFKIKAKDLLARVIQHEMDHLNGILIIDKK